jgi:hypothetical protein
MRGRMKLTNKQRERYVKRKCAFLEEKSVRETEKKIVCIFRGKHLMDKTMKK